MSESTSENQDVKITTEINESERKIEHRNMFDGIAEDRITFCIDTSGSMYHCLDAVKEQLIEALTKLTNRANIENRTLKFNLVEFSTEVVQWSDKLVNCTRETVSLAAEWIQALKPKTGTNTLDALLCAFSDAKCEAVYLVTDGIPDRNVDHVIDEVVRAARNRPIHCFYICESSPNHAAIEFIRELATETYGSLKIVVVQTHGVIESITLVYDTDMDQKMLQSTDGNIFPADQKVCSVVASLEDLHMLKALSSSYKCNIRKYGENPLTLATTPYPYCLLPWPYRYYHYFVEPISSTLGWSRYRPAKAWLKHANEFMNRVTNLTLGAGSLLINVKVLAKRHVDGFFYAGVTKTQILENKFLVEFSPCKHGSHNNTEYQETFVHDIVSLTDALRHPVLTDDRVLAPWEPEGERYAPGVIIDGQEKRMAEGEIDDKSVVVTFYNGKTVTVNKNRAVWVPKDLHDRITYELRLPKSIRQEFSQRGSYDNSNITGYPLANQLSFPTEFNKHPSPAWYANSNTVLNNGNGLRYSFCDSTANTYKQFSEHNGMYASDTIKHFSLADTISSDLTEKIRSQISQNKSFLDNIDRLNEQNHDKSSSITYNCNKREDDVGGEMRKSVSFADKLLVLGDEYDGHRPDAGILTDISISDSEYDVGNYDNGSESVVEVRKKLHRRKMRRSKSLQPWRYWKNEPAPSVHDPLHMGPYRKGPYRDSASAQTFLSEAKRNSQIDWSNPMYQIVDSYAKYKSEPTVGDCLKMPRPPNYRPPRQAPGRDISSVLGEHQLPREIMADARNDYRQGQVLKREIALQKRAAEEEMNQQRALDQRRCLASCRLQKDIQRHNEQTNKEENHITGKRINHQHYEQQQQSKVQSQEQRYANRIAAKSQEKENRTLKAEQNKHEEDLKWSRRYAAKEVQAQHRVEIKIAKAVEADAQEAQRAATKQRTAAQHTAYFRQKEADAQRYKQMNCQIKEQSLAIYRSQVLP